MEYFNRINPKAEKILKSISKIGLCEELEEPLQFNDEPKIPIYTCLPNKNAKDKYRYSDVYGYGSSMEASMAKVKACGEFLERLSIYNPIKTNLIKSEYNSNRCLNPLLFCYKPLVSQVEDEFQKKALKSHYYWSKSIDYINKKPVLIPAQVVYLAPISKQEPRLINEQITTGTAFDKGKKAFEYGFLEAIERDAFILSYLNKRPVNKIVGFSGAIKNLIDYIKRYYIEIHVFDITTDLTVPSFMTIAVDKTGIGPGISVGTKAGFDHENTILGSILESIQPRRYSRSAKKLNGNVSELIAVKGITSIETRYNYWYPKKMIKYLDFWLKDSNKIKFDKLPEYVHTLDKAVGILKSKGYHVFYTDVTLNEIKKANFKVVKVLIPEIHPLYISEKAKVLYSVHGGNIESRKDLKPHPFA